MEQESGIQNIPLDIEDDEGASDDDLNDFKSLKKRRSQRLLKELRT